MAIAASTAIRSASGASGGVACRCQSHSSWLTSWGRARASAQQGVDQRHGLVPLDRHNLARRGRRYGRPELGLGAVCRPVISRSRTKVVEGVHVRERVVVRPAVHPRRC